MQLKVTSELSKESSPDPNLKYLLERMYSLHRNTNKKLVRRDKAISEQAERLDKQKMELDKLQMKFTQMQSHVQQLKKDKDQLRHKANYWRTKTNQMKSSSDEREIETMVDKQRQDLQNIEDHNIELRDKLSELSTDEQIETFYKGRFTDDVRTCCYELLSLNVGIRNVELVIRSVMKHIVHQPIGRLPNHTVLCRMMLEGLLLSEIQLGEILSEEDMHTVNKKVYISALNPCLKHSHSTQKGCQTLKIFFTVSVALIWHLLAPLYCLYNSLQVDI